MLTRVMTKIGKLCRRGRRQVAGSQSQHLSFRDLGHFAELRGLGRFALAFKTAQKWRTGSEGRISVLKRRHGLNRCRYKGSAGIQRWVGLSARTSQPRVADPFLLPSTGLAVIVPPKTCLIHCQLFSDYESIFDGGEFAPPCLEGCPDVRQFRRCSIQAGLTNLK